MAEFDDPYSPVRYAYVGRDSTSPPDVLGTEWVGLLRIGGSYRLAHLDQNFCKIRPFDVFATEAQAQAHAEAEYELRPEDWRDGRVRSLRGYLHLRHAYIGLDSTTPPDVQAPEWVGVFRYTIDDGSSWYGVEHLDKDFNETCADEEFPTEAEAQAHAEATYELSSQDWREGDARHAPKAE